MEALNWAGEHPILACILAFFVLAIVEVIASIPVKIAYIIFKRNEKDDDE